ncbi:MAG TPA: metallophosphoesterase family protein [Candidatus Limnocylindrales bacterium]|nr:metallophosphoesterase family protein [Candidatus Limnocylindrales bacterium]
MSTPEGVKIGVISDTHNFFDPKIPGLFNGVEHILHAGDIGLPRILLDLEAIAPVTAVSGNTDDPGFRYSLTEVIQLAERKFLIHHIVQPHSLSDMLKERIARERPDVVVFGHTHKPFYQTIDGVIFFNPGYTGKSRFGMERTLAILYCDEKGIRPEFLRL